MIRDRSFVFIDGDSNNNPGWFQKKYFAGGANARFFTFQLVLNLLHQRHENPVIIETGCQRQIYDLGAGMSTSIFAEYIYRYGGSLHVVEIDQRNLGIASECVQQWRQSDMRFYKSDSVKFLSDWKGKVDLLYLDSYDYPIGTIWDHYGGRQNLEKAMAIVDAKSHTEVLQEFHQVIDPCQEHCLREFKAIEAQLDDKTVLMIDDNKLAGRGKPGTLKPYLEERNWICLLDFQQTVWVRSI